MLARLRSVVLSPQVNLGECESSRYLTFIVSCALIGVIDISFARALGARGPVYCRRRLHCHQALNRQLILPEDPINKKRLLVAKVIGWWVWQKTPYSSHRAPSKA